jgi:hypothetical protein
MPVPACVLQWQRMCQPTKRPPPLCSAARLDWCSAPRFLFIYIYIYIYLYRYTYIVCTGVARPGWRRQNSGLPRDRVERSSAITMPLPPGSCLHTHTHTHTHTHIYIYTYIHRCDHYDATPARLLSEAVSSPSTRFSPSPPTVTCSPGDRRPHGMTAALPQGVALSAREDSELLLDVRPVRRVTTPTARAEPADRPGVQSAAHSFCCLRRSAVARV